MKPKQKKIKGYWKGKPIEELNLEELQDAFQELGTYYENRIKGLEEIISPPHYN